jgi:hypothetical protein
MKADKTITRKENALVEDEDFYWEGATMVFTARFHLKRGACCGSGCRHCPYSPRHQAGTVTRAENITAPKSS